ncbi:MAG TPA: helix-turn-helix transcriptional regulator [Candidatus Paceibacterota bacterium]
MSNISKNIRKMREMKGLSQEKLARLADVANNTIVKIEAGKNQNPTLDTLNKIAKALEVTIDDLANNKYAK